MSRQGGKKWLSQSEAVHGSKSATVRIFLVVFVTTEVFFLMLLKGKNFIYLEKVTPDW